MTIIACSTVLGFVVALGRRSHNPLASALATVFIEATRNTPLVVQLLFWYSAVTFGLPPMAQAFEPLNGVFLTDRGLYLPSARGGAAVSGVMAVMLIAIAAALVATIAGRRQRMVTGKPNRYGRIAAAGALAVIAATWVVASSRVEVTYPVAGKFNFSGGITLTPEFVAIVLGLVIYSTAFTSEIIRGGIDAIGRGQWEAGRATGLTDGQTLRLVIVPQALRIIIPPMTSQYINIVKNSTLALVVGFPELNFVTATTINQTGQAIEGIAILMLAFLAVSASASLLMNWYHRRLALPTR